MAWRELTHDQCSLLDAIRGAPGSDGLDSTLVALLHQSSFLHGSLLGRATDTWDVSARWLCRATRLRGDGCDGGADSGDDDGSAPQPWMPLPTPARARWPSALGSAPGAAIAPPVGPRNGAPSVPPLALLGRHKAPSLAL